MNLTLTGIGYAPYSAPTSAPYAYETGVRLYSTKKKIEDTINKGFHDDGFLFLLVCEGTFTFVSTYSKNEFGCGLMVIPPSTEREFILLNMDFKGKLFCLPASMVSGVWSSSLFTCLDIKSIIILESYYDLMQEALSQQDSPYSRMELESLCNAFTISCRQHFKPILGDNNMRSSVICSNFLLLLDRHCSQNRNLKFYADRLDLSPKYLSAVISSTTKKKAGKWICEYSIAHAKTLLNNTRMSIAEVAEAMGFRTSSEFCRYFKKNTGQTPLSFRGCGDVTLQHDLVDAV